MSGRKERTMRDETAKRDPGRRTGPPWAIAAAALALLGALATPASAERSRVAVSGTSPEVQRARSKRWWLDFWAHSMQEQAFVTWMTQSTGGIEWMYLMPTQEVNAAYAWWLAIVWAPGDPPK